MATIKGKNYTLVYDGDSGQKFPGNQFNAKAHYLMDQCPAGGAAASDEFVLAENVSTGILLEAGVLEDPAVNVSVEVDGVAIAIGEEIPKGQIVLIPDAGVLEDEKLYIKYAGQN